ncbi:hypothetical protein J3D55_001573 [Chryseobacterium ginsenosidimutans]|nr:hypothetical protein [Chryseobacterium ginsenosidimutans]
MKFRIFTLLIFSFCLFYGQNLPDKADKQNHNITLQRFPEVEDVSVMNNTPIEPPFIKAFIATPDLEIGQAYLNDDYSGIAAKYAWSREITGQNIKIHDVEMV